MKRTLLLLVTALVVCVLGLEVFLQIGAWVVGASGRDPVAGWISGHTRVLTLGDSNTYGLYLPADQGYPAQFEALWNETVDDPKVEVINMGYPGTNSSVLLKNLPGLLQTFHPDFVFVMVGVNDFWTDAVSTDESKDAGPASRLADWLRKHSRVYKLAYMIRRAFYDPAKLDLGERKLLDPDSDDTDDAKSREAAVQKEAETGETDGLAELRYGDAKFELGFTVEKRNFADDDLLRRNLERIVTLVRDAGSQPVLLTYPSSDNWYGRANRILRMAAQSTDTPLVDIGLTMLEYCADSTKCPDLFFGDSHARKPGYTIAAKKLVRDLRTAGIFDAPH